RPTVIGSKRGSSPRRSKSAIRCARGGSRLPPWGGRARPICCLPRRWRYREVPNDLLPRDLCDRVLGQPCAGNRSVRPPVAAKIPRRQQERGMRQGSQGSKLPRLSQPQRQGQERNQRLRQGSRKVSHEGGVRK